VASEALRHRQPSGSARKEGWRRPCRARVPNEYPAIIAEHDPGDVRIRDTHAIRKIRLHAIRHTTASLLKDLKAPPRDAQIILGHAHTSTTQQICTPVDRAARRKALTRLNKLLGGTE
jgi:integrase